MKILINACYGGFGLSDEAIMMYGDVKKWNLQKHGTCWYMDGIQDNDHFVSCYSIPRDDRELIAVVEALGEKASGEFSRLRIVEIPDDVNWEIHEYDGKEWVAEVHRTWY
jgi:hypothetical protein